MPGTSQAERGSSVRAHFPMATRMARRHPIIAVILGYFILAWFVTDILPTLIRVALIGAIIVGGVMVLTRVVEHARQNTHMSRPSMQPPQYEPEQRWTATATTTTTPGPVVQTPVALPRFSQSTIEDQAFLRRR